MDKESSIVPVWISLPRLPIQFFKREALFQIAALIGTPLRLDAATISLKRPSIARVQVEIDLLKPNPTKVWIGMENLEGNELYKVARTNVRSGAERDKERQGFMAFSAQIVG